MSMKNMLSFPYKTIIEGFVDAGETSSPLFGFASKAVVGSVRVGGCVQFVQQTCTRLLLAGSGQYGYNLGTLPPREIVNKASDSNHWLPW